MFSSLRGSVIAGTSRVSISRYSTTIQAKKKLVILGSGWAGYNLARRVDKSLYDVTLVSPVSYFSFTPFLASTSVGTLEFRCATEPVRGIKGLEYAQGWADSIDFERRELRIESSVTPPHAELAAMVARTHPNHPGHPSIQFYNLPYDKLVIAVGCYSASFGIPGVKKHAHFLKDIRDARKIRRRLLECLEQASEPTCSPELRRALLSFKIVGGGPTGVEWAAELHDFVHRDVYRLYPHLKDQVRITLYDVAPGILINFDASLRAYAEKKFHRDGVTIRPNSSITAMGEDWVELDGKERHPYGLLVWSTGLCPNPFIASLPVKKHERSRAILVDKWQRVVNTEGQRLKGVFAIGDNATPADGPPLPATAQVATQQAKWLAKALNAHGRGQTLESQPGFEWKNWGSMVYVGNSRALVDRSREDVAGPKSRMAGWAAWILWRSYYAQLAMGWRNKVLVPIHWTLASFFGRDITRF
ncbi:hypothetical protein TREMEDRAFT_45240 [Tremella mesenterica DSM 1558]|uniref:uncharacterized protein n=1 Tax=Tremella mesenterica (strain ATCC 24925 / CBS 8224 / DSM 1558 / NBRC 9311 / NRRL Y-6157 / RJB 2259-6 / UBC 559-6) TaxID=578456 RepID=UPI0003F4944E|nr:uncharacterized protein TREMEDRAFT_45240 [Tremella mesenterica DSM 1558]EIW67161.1 hypothetical protein TREMEDRAFT_45240 [Tremella mesenterica DSM 1558]